MAAAVIVGATSSKFLSWRFVVQVLVLLQHIANSQTLALSLTIGSKVTVTTSTASSLVIPGATSASCFLGNPIVLQPTTARHSCSTTISMVEGHSVHRVATLHRKRLVGKCFQAWSPNGRFTDGAAAINGKPFTSIEAVGKNLFAFFGGGSDADSNKKQDAEVVVVHVHFGMAGAWAVYDTGTSSVPAPTKTNRLRLEALAHGGGGGSGLVADLSAMTVQYGGMDLYTAKRSKLGEDPLRDDAQPELLWTRVQKSKKSIGALIMDQSYFTGPGNIYRAEILFKAGLHPNRLGTTLSRTEFETVWYHTVDLLRRGYHTGSIITVDPDEARDLGQPTLRRYIYNTAQCPRCATPIQAWQIAARTCYACPNCQPLTTSPTEQHAVTTAAAAATSVVVTPDRTSANSSRSQDKSVKTVIPFNSHCARESVSSRLAETGPTRLTVKELKEQLTIRCIPFSKNAKKATLVDLFATATTPATTTTSSTTTRSKKSLLAYERKTLDFNSAATAISTESSSRSNNSIVSSETAALEKALAGENLAVEHIAELAPAQARAARAKAIANAIAAKATSEKAETSSTIETNDEEERRRRIAQRMTVPELKTELTFRKVPFLSKAKKATLIDLLLLSSSAASEKEDVMVAAATAVKKPTTTKKEKETRGGGRRNMDRQQRRSKRIKME